MRLPLAVLICLLIAPADGATIFRCTIDGVQSYQDHACPDRDAPPTPLSAEAQALAHKERTLTLRRKEMVRMLRNLTLQQQQDQKRLTERRLLNDEDPPSVTAEQDLLRDYQQRLQRARLNVEQIDSRLSQVREQQQRLGIVPKP